MKNISSFVFTKYGAWSDSATPSGSTNEKTKIFQLVCQRFSQTVATVFSLHPLSLPLPLLPPSKLCVLLFSLLWKIVSGNWVRVGGAGGLRKGLSEALPFLSFCPDLHHGCSVLSAPPPSHPTSTTTSLSSSLLFLRLPLHCCKSWHVEINQKQKKYVCDNSSTNVMKEVYLKLLHISGMSYWARYVGFLAEGFCREMDFRCRWDKPVDSFFTFISMKLQPQPLCFCFPTFCKHSLTASYI